MPLLPILHAAATWIMVGVILCIQLLVYPQFLRVGIPEFAAYHTEHMRRITWIVAPVMLVEAACAVGLVVYSSESVLTWTGLVLVAAIWLETWLVEVPLHTRIVAAKDDTLIRRLVRANARRTVLWCARGVLAGWLVFQFGLEAG